MSEATITTYTSSKTPWSGRRKSIIRHGILLAFLFVMVYPLLWMITSAFKPGHLILTEPGLIPTEFTLANFTEGWNALNRPFALFFLNSTIIAVGAIVGNLVSCSLAAYALARLNFRMKKIYFPIILLTLMLPFHVLIIPQYIIFSNLGLVNTFIPLLLPKFLATDAFFVFLMVQFIRSIPRDLDRAAQVDGASAFRVFWDIVLPLMRPALITTTIFTFIWTWNDFFTPLIYLTKTQLFTVTVALNALVDSESQLGIGRLFAMSLLSLMPVLIVFTVAQKYLIRGIATTGLK
jgi:multiple sugar transport system permease protein